MRGLPGNTPSAPLEYLQLPEVVPPDKPGPNWRAIDSIAVSFDETKLYGVDSTNGLVHFISNQPRLQEIGTVYVGKTAKSIALSADGRKLYVAVEQPIPSGKIHVLDAETRQEISSIGNVGCPEDVFAARTKPLVFAVSQCGLNNDPLYVIDTREDQVIKVLPGFAVPSKVMATADGGIVYVPTDDGLKIVQNYLSDRPTVKIAPIFGISAMALTLDESTLIIGRERKIRGNTLGELVSYNSRTGALCGNKPFGLVAPPTVIAIAPDGTLLTPMPQASIEGADGNRTNYEPEMKVGDSRALICSPQK